jgi:hypothetical protein
MTGKFTITYTPNDHGLDEIVAVADSGRAHEEIMRVTTNNPIDVLQLLMNWGNDQGWAIRV